MSRYIDGDALFSEVTNSYRWATGEARKAYRNVLDMICDADNKDVEEVKHGEYINDQGTQLSLCTAECSCCNKITATGLYCMWCGAKMDKEKENDRT